MKNVKFIKYLCHINYEDATNLVNNNIISIKEYKEMVKMLIIALHEVQK